MPKNLGAIGPVVLTIITIALIATRPSATVFGNVLFSNILSIIFIGANYFLVSLISARSYVQTGSPGFLLLGASLVIAGCASVLTYTFSNQVNYVSTVFNLGYLSAAILSIASTVSMYFAKPPTKPINRKWVGRPVIVYGVLAALSVLIAFSALNGVTPTFINPEADPTPLRVIVVGLTIILFGASSVISLQMYRESRSNILFWYAGGLALLAVSFLPAFFLNVAYGTELYWIGGISKYLSGIYFLILVLSATTKPARPKDEKEKMSEEIVQRKSP